MTPPPAAHALADTVASIAPPDADVERATLAAMDMKVKPRGSLGRLEALAARIAAIRGTATPGRLHPAVVVCAGDHGVAREGVSAYPQEVTRQMLATYAGGGAAVCVLAREAGADLVVVDCGVAEPIDDPRVLRRRQGPGTASIADGPAMTRAQAEAALEAGIGLVDELHAGGAGLVALGEMGIGNTTSASALCAALLPADPAEVCGPGTGLDGAGVTRKVAVVRRALEANRPDPADPLGVLAALGGFEIATLAGVVLGAAARRMPVLLDGAITTAAALVAVRIAPAAHGALLAAHLSPEPAHRRALAALGLAPIVDLGMRLGEGSGAALALPVVGASLAVLADMATFADAGVSDSGA
ncbi:MAG: nicotinate-nucleotide--dimethylbenzimidazole phosphoribosyltransferase [Actinomycetota bacterium]